MTDDIEIHFNQPRGLLELACGDDAFARVREAVIAEAGASDAIGGDPDAVCLMFIGRKAVPSAEPASQLRDQIALLGCGLVAFMFLFLLLVGAATIAGWIR